MSATPVALKHCFRQLDDMTRNVIGNLVVLDVLTLVIVSVSGRRECLMHKLDCAVPTSFKNAIDKSLKPCQETCIWEARINAINANSSRQELRFGTIHEFFRGSNMPNQVTYGKDKSAANSAMTLTNPAMGM